MNRVREVKIFTPEEKREWAMMRAIDRCEESLARIFRGGHDPEMAMLLQSAAQQEELEAAKKALKCVATRLRVFCRAGLREEQKRWIGHTQEIAEAALDKTNDAAREMVGGLTTEQLAKK